MFARSDFDKILLLLIRMRLITRKRKITEESQLGVVSSVGDVALSPMDMFKGKNSS